MLTKKVLIWKISTDSLLEEEPRLKMKGKTKQHTESGTPKRHMGYSISYQQEIVRSPLGF